MEEGGENRELGRRKVVRVGEVTRRGIRKQKAAK